MAATAKRLQILQLICFPPMLQGFPVIHFQLAALAAKRTSPTVPVKGQLADIVPLSTVKAVDKAHLNYSIGKVALGYLLRPNVCAGGQGQGSGHVVPGGVVRTSLDQAGATLIVILHQSNRQAGRDDSP